MLPFSSATDLVKPEQVGTSAAIVTGAAERLQRAGAGQPHPQQWVSQRQAVFKDFTRTLEPMGLMARERQPFDPDAFSAAALRLQTLSSQPWPFFTPDSNCAPTKARARVWEQPEAFEQAQAHFRDRVEQLVQASQTGALDAVRPAVEQVQNSCKACHDRFRQL
jgi:cytochrome c556